MCAPLRTPRQDKMFPRPFISIDRGRQAFSTVSLSVSTPRAVNSAAAAAETPIGRAREKGKGKLNEERTSVRTKRAERNAERRAQPKPAALYIMYSTLDVILSPNAIECRRSNTRLMGTTQNRASPDNGIHHHKSCQLRDRPEERRELEMLIRNQSRKLELFTFTITNLDENLDEESVSMV